MVQMDQIRRRRLGALVLVHKQSASTAMTQKYGTRLSSHCMKQSGWK